MSSIFCFSRDNILNIVNENSFESIKRIVSKAIYNNLIEKFIIFLAVSNLFSAINMLVKYMDNCALKKKVIGDLNGISNRSSEIVA